MNIDRRTALSLALVAPLAFGAKRADAQELDALYAAAKSEGSLTVYTGGAAIGSPAVIDAFNAQFPGIDVHVIAAYSNVNDVKIDEQLRSHSVTADIASFQTVQDFVRWNAAGALLPYRFPGFSLFDSHYVEPHGAFAATDLFPLTYGYNTQLVAAANVPRSALDFLRPEFRGKAITCYPHDDDATLYLFYTLQQKYGWSYVDRYMQNEPAFIEGHLGVVKAIAAGTKLVTFDCSAHTALVSRDQGAPVGIAFSPVDDSPVFYNTSAILRPAPHPNAAKLFIAWYMSRAEQMKTGTWSARSDVPAPDDLKPLSAYRVATDYRSLLVDTALVAELRRRFLAYTGPVVNRS